MADIINLNKNRKAKASLKKEKTAAENRVKFGRSKEEKQLEKKEKERQAKYLEDHRLEDKK